MATKKPIITKHALIPSHEKISEEDKKKLFEEMNIKFKDLPKIRIKDASLVESDVKPGDVIKVIRPSMTSKEIMFYRGVIDA